MACRSAGGCVGSHLIGQHEPTDGWGKAAVSAHEARVDYPPAISRMVPQDREPAVDVWRFLVSHVELVNFVLDRDSQLCSNSTQLSSTYLE
jgi:hypothetical protein